MNFCPNCGNTLVNVNCPACNYQDKNNIGFNILSFFFPLVGLVLYILWKDEHPVKAKGCGKAALASVIVNAILTVIILVLYFVFFASTIANTINTMEAMDTTIENGSLVMAAMSLLPI